MNDLAPSGESERLSPVDAPPVASRAVSQAPSLDVPAPDLRALRLETLAETLEALGEPGYRAGQVFRWIHGRGARDFEAMTNVKKSLRETLRQKFRLSSMGIVRVERALDGTRKYALRTHSGEIVECVYIPDASSPGRNTLCISSQVGCGLDCKFCLTASLGLVRNLSFGEIVEQVTRVKEDLAQDEHRSSAPKADASRIANIVMMGMGEPLQNYGPVVDALRVISSDDGHGISLRRITVSTVGLAPRIPRLGRDVAVNLAVSLNATTDEVRDRIMPINRRYNIATLLEACRAFPLPERRRITFEYVLLEGCNDSDDDARRLIKLLRPIRSKVNLIPFNPHRYSSFRRPSEGRIQRFREIVNRGGLTAMVRTPRGDDILSACGQLGAAVEGKRRRLPVCS